MTRLFILKMEIMDSGRMFEERERMYREGEERFFRMIDERNLLLREGEERSQEIWRNHYNQLVYGLN